MHWTRDLLVDEEQQELTLSFDGNDSHKFYDLHTGLYEIAYGKPDDEDDFKLVIQGPKYTKWWHKPWHVELEMMVNILSSDNNVPPEEKFTISFNDESLSCKQTLDWYQPSDLKLFCSGPNFIKTKISLRIVAYEGLPNSNMWEVVQQMDQTTNIRLIVDNKSIHVPKQVLMENSSVFHSMFNGNYIESEQSEIELKDVDYHQFIIFLGVLHGFYHPNVDCETVDNLLHYADRFDSEIVRNKCLDYMKLLSSHEIIRFLLWTEDYKDPAILEAVMESITNESEHYEVMTSPEFVQLDIETRDTIIDTVADRLRSKAIDRPLKQTWIGDGWYYVE